MDESKLTAINAQEAFVIDKSLPVIDATFKQELEINKLKMANNLFKMFVKSLKEELKAINQAHQQNDFTQLTNLVYSLYGAICYCGTPRLQKAAKQLYALLFENGDKEQINRLLTMVNDEAKLVLAYADKLYL